MPCKQVGVPLSTWWGKSSVVVSRNFSGVSSSSSSVMARAIMPRVPVTMGWNNGNVAVLRSISGRSICNGCANNGALIAATRKYSSQRKGLGEYNKGVSNADRKMPFNEFGMWSKLHEWKMAEVGVRYKSGKGYSNFGHNPKPMSTFTFWWGMFLGACMVGCWVDWP